MGRCSHDSVTGEERAGGRRDIAAAGHAVADVTSLFNGKRIHVTVVNFLFSSLSSCLATIMSFEEREREKKTDHRSFTQRDDDCSSGCDSDAADCVSS